MRFKIFVLSLFFILTSCADSLDKNLQLEADEQVVEDLSFFEYRAKAAKYLIIHCTATDPKYPWSAQRLTDFFKKERKWNRLGYNYYITQDGEIHALTPINNDSIVNFDELTYNASGLNSVSFAISLEGGSQLYKGKLIDADNFTENQKISLVYLVGVIKGFAPSVKIIPHNSVNKGKSCPVMKIDFLNYEQQG